MKHLVFGMAFVFGVPVMAMVAMNSAKLRGLLLALLVFSVALGDSANINFVSMENYRGPDRGFEVNLTDLISLGLILALLIRFPTQLKWAPVNTTWMVGLFGLAVISAMAAPLPILAAFTLFKLVKIYLLFWCVANCLRVTDARYVWMGLVATGVYVTYLAFQQKFLAGIYRIHGPFDHSNTVPVFLNQIVPVTLIWGLLDKRLEGWQALLSTGAGLGMAAAVVFTFSRAGLVLVGAGVAGSIGLCVLKSRATRVTTTSAFVAIAGVVGLALMADSIIDRFLNAPEASGEARDEFNIAAQIMADDNAFGVGLNSFSRVLSDTPRYGAHIVIMEDEEESGVAHHIYWLTAAEMGYVGVTGFVLVIGRFTLLALWGSWKGRKQLEGALLFGLFVGASALHAQGLLEWAFRISPVTYMYAICSGLIVGFYDQVKRDTAGRPA